ncbi:hypothetical protein F5Y05DRAFT_310022 [Hypoxylon sp. FL0543]|nr:hypothetical protein F5Y05DRAFT_310022 [Hypoxylon sp. FL0543]
MDYQVILLALFTLIAAARATASPVLFRGTSVITLPNKTPPLNSNTTHAATFFCYMAENGYFSFGWWIPPSSIGKCSHCQPDSDSFHWIELGQKGSCNEATGSCLYRTQRIPVREPDDQAVGSSWDRSLEYSIQPRASEKGDDEETTLHYIDAGGAQFHGTGTRQNLSGGRSTAGECRKALRTLKQTYERLDIDLSFEIGNPCAQDTNTGHDWVSEL